ncbi:MAG: hypothetical protein RR348_04935 [Clostridia bacterium]
MNDVIKISKILNIKPPTIVYSSDTKTTIAVSKINNNTIIFNNNFLPKTNFDKIFAIAHECRHFWQFKNNVIDFDNYLISNDLSKIDYNIQPAELDAHSFACAYLMKTYNVKPLFLGFDEKIKNNIYAASNKIIID